MKKSFVFSIILVTLLIFSVNLTVFAEDYSFDRAEFVVQLNADGSADVLEKWQVSYYSGSYSRFYKNIYLNVPKEEQCSISDWSVRVDETPCTYTENREDRPDFCYGLDNKGDVLTYEVYAKSSNQTRTYSISYRLNDVVKCVNNEYYLFTYRFLPDGYKNTIKDFSVYIFTPSSDAYTEILYSTSGIEVSASSELNGQTVYGEGVRAANVSDMYKVKMRIDGNVFSNLPQSSYLTDKDLNSGSNVNIGNLDLFDYLVQIVSSTSLIISLIFSIILAMLYRKYTDDSPIVVFITSFFLSFFPVAGFIVNLVLLYNVVKIIRIKKMIDKDPNIVNTTIKKWSGYFYNPAQFVSNFVVNKYMGFLTYLIDLYNQGVIKFSFDYSIISYPINHNYNDYRDNILRVLDNCLNENIKAGLNVEQRNGYWELPTSYLYTYLSNVSIYKDIDSLISQLLYVEGITNNKEFKKDMKFLKVAVKFVSKNNNFGYLTFGAMLSQYSNLVKLLCFVLQDKKSKPSNNMDGIAEIHSLIFMNMANDGYDNYYRETHRSSSDSSGCSSCSSCSSCGGCGGVD